MKLEKNLSVLDRRLARLQQNLTAASFDFCLIDHPLDLLYFTGLQLSAGRLFVQATQAVLFVDGRYIQMAQEQAPMPSILDEGTVVSDWIRTCPAASTCAFDGSRTSYTGFIHLKDLLEPLNIQLVSAQAFYQRLRCIKDDEELTRMRQSAQLLYRCFSHLQTIIKIGMTEKQVARRFEIWALENGADKLAFDPIIAFGKNSAMPHYHPGDVCLQAGDLILIDIGVSLHHYHSDMTRVLFCEPAPAFFLDVYRIVKASHDAALEICRSGATVGALDEAARKVMRHEKMEPYFLHSLGHGIGLETHEFPRLKSRGEDTQIALEAGMVVTIEPGLYYPGQGGIRYEDTVIVTESGYENLYPEDGPLFIRGI